MSVETSAAVAVEPDVKPAAVVENVNDHTPDPETPPVADKVPDPPRPDVEGLEQLRETVAQLATAVAALTDTVTGQHKDESPKSLPWTHRGSPVRDDDE